MTLLRLACGRSRDKLSAVDCLLDCCCNTCSMHLPVASLVPTRCLHTLICEPPLLHAADMSHPKGTLLDAADVSYRTHTHNTDSNLLANCPRQVVHTQTHSNMLKTPQQTQNHVRSFSVHSSAPGTSGCWGTACAMLRLMLAQQLAVALDTVRPFRCSGPGSTMHLPMISRHLPPQALTIQICPMLQAG